MTAWGVGDVMGQGSRKRPPRAAGGGADVLVDIENVRLNIGSTARP